MMRPVTLRAGRSWSPAECAQNAAASSVVTIAALAGGGDDALSLLQQHNTVFGTVRTRWHPVVVAGDTMLVVAAHDTADTFADAGGRDRLVVVRLYDVGQSLMQLAAERLTSTANAHAASITVCDKLNLIGNEIGDCGGLLLAEALRSNTTLTSL